MPFRLSFFPRGPATVIVYLARISSKEVRFEELTVRAGATAAEVLAQAGATPAANDAISVYGLRVRPETVLKPRDRLEVACPLIIDPKEARKARAR